MMRINPTQVELESGPAIESVNHIGNAQYGQSVSINYDVQVGTGANNVPPPVAVSEVNTDFTLRSGSDFNPNLFGQVSSAAPITNYAGMFGAESGEPVSIITRITRFVRSLFNG